MSHGVGHRRGSDLALLWLWRRPAAVAPIGSLAWEPPYAMGMAPEKTKKKKKKTFLSHAWHLCQDLLTAFTHLDSDRGNWPHLTLEFEVFWVVFFCFVSFCFLLFRAAYGSSQARGQIGATAAGLTKATAIQDPRCICDQYHSSKQHQILNPLS